MTYDVTVAEIIANTVEVEGRRMLTPPEAAKVLGCSSNTIRRMLQTGDLDGFTVAYKSRKMLYVSPESVVARRELMVEKQQAVEAKSLSRSKTRATQRPASADDTLHLLELAQLRSDRDQYRSELLVASAAAQHAQRRVVELELELARLRSVVVLQAEHQAKSLQQLLEPNQPS
jgi:hypothetical protein